MLDLHNIREGVDNPEIYNWSFFVIGIVIAAVGWLLLRHPDTLRTRGPMAPTRGPA